MKKRKRKKLDLSFLWPQLIIIIGIFLSFWSVDFFLRILLHDQISFYSPFSISPNFFTASFITLIIGILFLLRKKIIMIVYPTLIVIYNLLIYLSYLSYNKSQIFPKWQDLSFIIENTSIEIVFICLVSIILMIGTTFFIKQKYLSITGRKNICLWLLTIILIIIIEKGSAIILLGPEKIQNQSSRLEYPKNIYLYEIDSNKKLEVVGFFEYWYLQTKTNIINQYHKNQIEINKNNK